ncbi:MAG: hypothetical protein QXK54_02780 [Ignisphaera sp.]
MLLLTASINSYNSYTQQQVQIATIFPDPNKITGQAVGSAGNKWATIRLTYVDVVANLWNIPDTAVGSITLTVTEESVTGEGDFSELYPTRVRLIAGPGFRYGINIWGSNPDPHPYFKLPIKLSELPTVKAVFNVSVDFTKTLTPIAINYYLWIPKTLRSGGTSRGDILISIQMYCSPEADAPGGTLVGSYIIPV